MSKYLIQTTEIYRADTENEVQSLIEEAKSAREYELSKYSSERKDIKVIIFQGSSLLDI